MYLLLHSVKQSRLLYIRVIERDKIVFFEQRYFLFDFNPLPLNLKMTQDNKRGKLDNYKGYKLNQSGANNIDVVDLNDPKITKEWFFESYIKPRRPAILKNHQKNSPFLRMDTNDFKIENILKTLTDLQEAPKLQVEELSNGGFGSGKSRLKISLTEFISRIKKGESLYLTTQYEENEPVMPVENEEGNSDDDNDEEGGFGDFGGFDANASDGEEFNDLDEKDDFDENDLDLEQALADEIVDNEDLLIYQPPLDRLIPCNSKRLPPFISSLLEPLVPQQINLWCGCTPSETEQLEISKRNGKVVNVNKGLSIDNATSTGLHHDHADNLYILVQGKKRFTLFSPDYATKLNTVGDVRHIYDSGVIDYIKNEKAPKWRNIRADGSCITTEEGIDDSDHKIENKDENEKMDPPSFCKIPPVFLHLDEVKNNEDKALLEKYCDEKYPQFSLVKSSAVQATLSDGDLLYLPAGWFHEVTSFGDVENSNIHTAINYWFVPPDGSSIEKPYTDFSYRIEFDEAYGDV